MSNFHEVTLCYFQHKNLEFDSKECFECVAKAAGVFIENFLSDGSVQLVDGSIWNPKNDNKDSQLLADKLDISISYEIEFNTVWAHYLLPGRFSKNREMSEFNQNVDKDIDRARREAVFMAAGYIGDYE